jgi:hypothetical protein
MIQCIMPTRKVIRKIRRTITLSPESDAFIKKQTRERKLGSHSAFLDQLLLEKAQEQQLAAYEAEVTAYYDSLTDEEVEEQRAWGQLAEQTLALTAEETPYVQSPARGDLVHKTADRPSRQRKSPGRHRVGQPQKQSSAR